MDIFTTQLTRVVPVPIKPTNLKVKALLKEAANSKLTKDPNHLENHEHYFTAEDDEYHTGQNKSDHESTNEHKEDVTSEQSAGEVGDVDGGEIINENKETDNKTGTKHLDLYA